jgi:hypothetical protein
VNGGTFNNNYDLVTFPAVDARNIVIQGFVITPKIASWSDLNPLPHNVSAAAYFANDVVTLNFGPFVSQRLYNLLQQSNSIPFPIARPDIPSIYVGLTNQQLLNQYGVSLGGAIAPVTAFTATNVIGLIAPKV